MRALLATPAPRSSSPPCTRRARASASGGRVQPPAVDDEQVGRSPPSHAAASLPRAPAPRARSRPREHGELDARPRRALRRRAHGRCGRPPRAPALARAGDEQPTPSSRSARSSGWPRHPASRRTLVRPPRARRQGAPKGSRPLPRALLETRRGRLGRRVRGGLGRRRGCDGGLVRGGASAPGSLEAGPRVSRRAAQLEVQDRRRERRQRRGEHADHDATTRPAPVPAESARRLDRAGDERDEEKRMKITPNTCQPLPRTSSRLRAERAEPGRALEHDDRRRHRPDRDQDQPGHDQQDQAEHDADAPPRSHEDQLAEHRRRRRAAAARRSRRAGRPGCRRRAPRPCP